MPKPRQILAFSPALRTESDPEGSFRLVEHALRPLSHPAVQADVMHTVTNGLGALPALARLVDQLEQAQSATRQ